MFLRNAMLMMGKVGFPFRLSLGVVVCTLELSAAVAARADTARIATFDAPRAFEAFHQAQAERAKFAEARQKTRSDERSEQLKLTRVELYELRDKVRDTSLPEDSRQEYFRKFQMKAHELNSLQRDINTYRQEQSRLIDEAMLKMTKHLLGIIRATVRDIAAAGSYDLVLETGGTTSSQVPALIYIRDATDITDQVIAELNKDAPNDAEVADNKNTGKNNRGAPEAP